ncbi:MAG: PAS domain S-box protein [Acidobacteria bacterium]|nr:PAS domain S-box protein [Acidobacteriota bacterium]
MKDGVKVTPDIIEDDRTVETLRQQFDLISALVGNAADGLYTVDSQAHFTFINPSAERMLGWPAGELLGRHVHETIHFQHADGTPCPAEECPLLNVLRSGESISDHEEVFTRRGGSLLPVLCSSAPIFKEGQVAGAVMSFRDISGRKRTEEALRESEERYRILFDSVPVAVFACDRNAVIQNYNRRAVELWGREPTCGVEQHCGSVKLYLPDGSLLPHQQSPMVEVLRTGIPANNVEVFIERPDSSRIAVIVNFAALKDGRGEIIGAITTFDDITELKRAEEALRESADRFRFLAESMPQKIFTARPNGEVDYFNRQWMEFTGLSFEQIRDWGWTQFIHPDDVEENVRRWQHSIDTGETFQFEHRFRRADGVYRWHLSRAHAMRDAEGRVLMWIGSNTDIDDVKRAQEERSQLLERESRALLEAEAARQRLHDLFMQAPAIICTLRGPEHVFDLANPLYMQLTGRRDASDVIGKPVREALPEIEGQGFFELLDNVYRTGERGDGTLDEVLVNFVYQPSLSARGEIDGIMVHAVEVTEQVRARQRVEEANRMKDEFLATLSHELRTPLTSILGWARMLSGGQLDEANTTRALETIERNAKLQSQLIEDILDVSRVITGKLRLEVQPVNLASVIEAAVDGVLPAADAKGIRLQRVLDSGTSMVSGDPARLQQIAWNLLSNAIKFTPKGGRVQIRLERINSHVEIIVTDTGQGISPDVLPHIFERFRQADSTATRKHSGLGLGLAIVRHLVEMHGGTVEAESGGEGQGASFTVKLPLVVVRSLEVRRAGEAERVHPTASSGVPFNCPPELDGLHVLVVDDEEDTRVLLTMVLEKCGASVTAVSTAQEAFAALKQSRPDVLVSDLGMPDEDGYSLIKQVRALPVEDGGQTPAAALTAYARVEDRMRVLRSGFQIHIPKPVEPAELVAVVANLAGRIGER